MKFKHETHEKIYKEAIKLVGKVGSANVTRAMVAEKVGCTPPLVGHYCGSIADARKSWAREAKKAGVAEPSKEQITKIGRELRGKPETKGRARSKAEVKAIKRNTATPVKTAKATKVLVKKVAAKKSAAKKATKAAADAVKKPTAAREPKLPPLLAPTI